MLADYLTDSQLLSLVRTVRSDLMLPPTLGSGSTDANAALALGIPALAIGVADGAGMHTLGERIELTSLELGRRQLELIVTRLLAPDRADVKLPPSCSTATG